MKLETVGAVHTSVLDNKEKSLKNLSFIKVEKNKLIYKDRLCKNTKIMNKNIKKFCINIACPFCVGKEVKNAKDKYA